jgi:predicted nucleic acid-binding Zn ribbon protein
MESTMPETSEAIDVLGKLVIEHKTKVVCPECRAACEFEGELDRCLVECPSCNAQLRIRLT